MIGFFDIGKAFDSINWNIMFKVFRDVKIDFREELSCNSTRTRELSQTGKD